jgi:hypothetical protein
MGSGNKLFAKKPKLLPKTLTHFNSLFHKKMVIHVERLEINLSSETCWLFKKISGKNSVFLENLISSKQKRAKSRIY